MTVVANRCPTVPLLFPDRSATVGHRHTHTGIYRAESLYVVMTAPHMAVLAGWTYIIRISQFLCPIELLWIPLVYLIYRTMKTDIVCRPLPVVFTPVTCLA